MCVTVSVICCERNKFSLILYRQMTINHFGQHRGVFRIFFFLWQQHVSGVLRMFFFVGTAELFIPMTQMLLQTKHQLKSYRAEKLVLICSYLEKQKWLVCT